MFDEPNEEEPKERVTDPKQRAQEKSDEFRIHAEVCAVFEGGRKFDAQLQPGLDPQLAREVQQRIARLEKAKTPDSPILPPAVGGEAAELLNLPKTKDLSTNDYHLYRRPGEVMIARWLEGEQVEAFYERIQAHFDVALEQYKEEEHQAQDWQQDPQTQAYLKALDGLEVKLADRYLRDLIRQHKLFVLSTLTADEMDILHLCDYVMGMPAAEVVGAASAPPEEGPTERDRAWFFKLFSLRGMHEGAEQMCFFAYLQKTEDTFESGW
jgi:hypothetical protein